MNKTIWFLAISMNLSTCARMQVENKDNIYAVAAVANIKVLFQDQPYLGALPLDAIKKNLRQYIEGSAKNDLTKLPGLLAKLDATFLDSFIGNLQQLDPQFLLYPNLAYLAIPLGGQFQVRVDNAFVPPNLVTFNQISTVNNQVHSIAKTDFTALQEEFRQAYPANRLHYYQGYRSYLVQEVLYKEQIAKKGSALGVALPGSSKHQLGIAVDLYLADSQNNIIWSWPTDIVKWLELHGPEFGIVHPMPSFDPPHYEDISAIHPQLIAAMQKSGLNIHDHYEINIALLAIYNKLRE